MIEKVSPGSSLRRKASDENAKIEVANWYASQKALGDTIGSMTVLSRHPDLIKIRNDSGSQRSRFDVLALGDPLILPSANEAEFLKQPLFKGIEPQAVVAGATHVGRWAMLLEPAAEDAIVRAVTGGTWPCLVDMKFQHHRRCDIAHEQYKLTSNNYGAAEILWHEKFTGTFEAGVGKAIVRIGLFESDVIEGKVGSGTIAAGGNGTVRIWRNGVVTSPLETVTGYNRWITVATLTTSLFLRLRYDRYYHRWDVIDHNCA